MDEKSLEQLNGVLQQALAHLKNKEYKPAIAGLSEVLAVLPQPEIFYNRGNAYYAGKQYQLALADFNQAIALKPDYTEAYNNRAVTYHALQENDLALQDYNHSIQLNADDGKTYYNRGRIFQSNKDYEAALADYNKAIEFMPNHILSYQHRAFVWKRLDKVQLAINDLTQVLARNCTHARAYNDRAICYQDLLQYRQALADYRQVLALYPGYDKAHYNLGIALLTLGEFKEGFKEYNHRFNGIHSLYDQHLFPEEKRWQGEKLKDKRVVLLTEQGVGDAIHFLRFGALLKEQGAYIIFCCEQSLIRLVENLNWFDELKPITLCECSDPKHDTDETYSTPSLAESDLPVVYDYFTTVVHAAGFFVDEETDIPSAVPYLFVHDSWHKPLATIEKFKVAVVWAGAATHGNDANRSISADWFMKLQAQCQLTFYSLQVGDRADEAEDHFIRLDSQIEDYADTAGFLAHMDLVISVDTSVVHLAGALNIPTWVLLPFAPDWRWLLEREDSPWYPSMRLFRQQKAGDWAAVFARVEKELRGLI